MNPILILNTIDEAGLRLLDRYHVGPALTDPEAILVRSAPVKTEDFSNLLAVARAGAGYNNITVPDATRRGICVFNTPGANANAVAELVFAMMGVHARTIIPALQFVQTVDSDDEHINEVVEAHKSTFRGFELRNKTLGIIGLGKIGTLVANTGISLGMRVVGYDPSPAPSNMHRLDPRVELCGSITEVLTNADILTVHVPAGDSTTHLIGTSEIQRMKPGCILMNFAREHIYDTKAVLTAIESKHVQAYITDFPSAAVLQHDKVIVTPHLGASTAESETNCAVMAASQLRDYLTYGTVTNSVNFPTVTKLPAPSVKTRLAVVNSDVPNMIATITGVLGSCGINIHAFTNESNHEIGYNLIDLEDTLSASVITQIEQLPGVLRVRVLTFFE
jgi:D-3-phosphoglycerate dehydrogenase